MTGKKKFKRPTTTAKDLYFGPPEQQAIKEFKHSNDSSEKATTYQYKIMPAFKKLVENLIFVYGFARSSDNISELITDCVSFLYENIHKFDESRGTKAFSYFNVIARNWLIVNSRRKSRFNNRHISIDDIESLSSKDKNQIANHLVIDSPDEVMIKSQLREDIRTILTKISLRLTQEHEKACMQAILTIFERIEDIDLLHKRAIFIYVRDISNLTTKQLSSAMSVIRKHYRDLIKNGHGIL